MIKRLWIAAAWGVLAVVSFASGACYWERYHVEREPTVFLRLYAPESLILKVPVAKKAMIIMDQPGQRLENMTLICMDCDLPIQIDGHHSSISNSLFYEGTYPPSEKEAERIQKDRRRLGRLWKEE